MATNGKASAGSVGTPLKASHIFANMAHGAVQWYAGVVMVQLWGPTLLNPDDRTTTAVMTAAFCAGAVAGYPQRLFNRYVLGAPKEHDAPLTVCLCIPVLTLDSIFLVNFTSVFPHLPQGSAILYGGLVLMVNAVTLLTEFWPMLRAAVTGSNSNQE